MQIVLGGAKPGEAKLGASQWWITRPDHGGGLREQSKVEAGKSSGWS